MTPDWPVIAAEIVMLPATIGAALLGTYLHHRHPSPDDAD